MDIFFFLVALVSLVLLIIGLIKPEKFKMEGRKKPLKVFGIPFLISFILFGAFADSTEEASSDVDDTETEEQENQEDQDDEEEQETFEVKFNEDISVDDDAVFIKAETNLLDGTIINYEISHISSIDHFVDGKIEVVDGKVDEEIDISDFPEGDIHVYVGFLPYNQDEEELMETYGDMGQNLEGDKVEYIDSLKANVVEFSLDFERESSIANLYNNEVLPWKEEIITTYDDPWTEHWQNSFSGLGEGTKTEADVIYNLEVLRDEYYTGLVSTIRDYEIPDGFEDDQIELIKGFQENMTTAVEKRIEVIEEAISMINNPSTLSTDKLLGMVEDADGYMLKAIADLVSLETELGINQ